MQFELSVYLIGQEVSVWNTVHQLGNRKGKNMRINRKMIVGAILCMIGAIVIDYPVIKGFDQKSSLPFQLIGLAIFVCAVVFIYQGKRLQRQQAKNREENNP
jgi:hypothetical protein